MASKVNRFLTELKRRKVTRVAVAYVVAGIAVVEGADIIGTPLGLSEGLIQSAAFLVVIGFPIAMVLAWAVDITPDGVRRTESLSPEEARPKAEGWWTPGRAVLAEVALVAVLAGGYFAFVRNPTPSLTEGRVPIAVLPFHNLSGEEEAEALTSGIHDDILTQLSKIHALRVTSRTSVLEYRETEKNVRRIGEELGVRAILEGGVQKDQNRIRINAQLVDTETDEHLWAETYDREYTIGALFAIQSDLAEKIAAALHATLRPEEASRIAALPTQDSVAYRLFLRGRELYGESLSEHETALELFRQATRLDPEFAEAYAYLASAHYHRVQDYAYPVEWADTVIALARKALDLDPELANAHNALALGFTLVRRRDEAREEYLRALDLDPSYSSPLNNLGVVASDLGRDDEGYEWFVRAIAVNPRSAIALANAGSAATRLEMFDEAARWFARADGIDPESSLTNMKWVILELSQGRLEEARARAEAYQESRPGDFLALVARSYAAILSGDVEATLELEGFFAQVPDWGLGAVPATIRTVSAWAHLEGGEAEEPSRFLEEARVWLEEAISRYGPEGDLQREYAALCALEGDTEEALRWLEGAFEAAGGSEYRLLRMDPRLASLSSDPRFEDLLERMEAQVAVMRGRVERGEVEPGVG